jgi:hypothetical protein
MEICKHLRHLIHPTDEAGARCACYTCGLVTRKLRDGSLEVRRFAPLVDPIKRPSP